MQNGAFDAAIPGQSLTAPPGATPMERPPQFVHLDDALEFFFNTLTQPKQVKKLELMLRKQVPVQTIVQTLLTQGIINGSWTVDLAYLMYQTAIWQVESIARLKGIKHVLKNEDHEYNEFLNGFVDLLDEKPKEEAPAPEAGLFGGLS